ncbi:MAG: murein biosynthesis integral membrane protein MurJ [Planctomycetes bacterium]|nr:murein biosynthesis integral membrane protein MurJ [Planctomycetota bacterium]
MAAPSRLINSARLIAALTLGSRILGLIRESVFGYYFSTSELLSAFRIAFMAPNLARRLFGEGALSAAMIPVLTQCLKEQGEEAARRFVGRLLTVLTVVLLVGLGAVESVLLVWRVLHDDLALRLTAVLMPYMVLICLVAVGSGVLNVRGHFAVPAAAPTILNIAIIIGALGGSLALGMDGARLMTLVCVAILLSGVLQVAATGAAFRHARFAPRYGWSRHDPQIRAVMKLMGPMVLGLSAVQINQLVDYVIAYLFVFDQTGERVGPAVLGFAQYLYQLPLGVFGISLATAIFPVLSHKAAEGDRAGMCETIGRGIRLGAFVSLPACAGLVLVATPLVAALYQRGDFDAQDTQRVSATLICYSLGLPAYFAQHVIVRAFYALRDSGTPAALAMRMVFINVAVNLVLVFVMEERGLALSTSLCATVQALWLIRRLRGVLPEMQWAEVVAGLGRMALAAVVMSAAVVAVDSPRILGSWAYAWTPLRLGVLVVVGLAVYGLAALALRIPELRAALRGERAAVAASV